jgi:hypothetical protein
LESWTLDRTESYLPAPRKKPNLNLLDSIFLVQGSVIDIAALFGVFACVGLMLWLRSNGFDFPLGFSPFPFLA